MPVVTVGGIAPAEIEIEGHSGFTIAGGGVMCQEIINVPAVIESVGVPAVDIFAASVELVLEFPAEIGIEGGGSFTLGAEITVPPAEIEIEGILPAVAFTVDAAPAEVEIEGIPAVSVVSSGVEIVLETPAGAEAEGIAPTIFFYDTYSILVNPAEIELGGIPAASFGAEIAVQPAEIEIEGVPPAVHKVYSLALTDGIFAWDTPSLDLSLLISEALAAVDTPTFQLCLLLADYINAIDALHGQQNLTMSASDTLAAVDAVDRITIIAATISEALAITDTIPSFIMTVLIADYMDARDAVSHQLIGTKTISETIVATDAVVVEWLLSIAESIASVDSISFGRVESLTEYLAIRGTLIGNQVYSAVISEAIVITDNAVAEWVLSIAESIAAADTIAFGRVAALTEYLTIRETLTGPGVFTRTISDAVAAADNAVIELVLGLIESLSIADVLAIGKIAAERLSERITVSDLLTELGVFGVTVQDTVGVSDSVQAIISLLISEGLVATDSTTYIKDIYLSLAETLGATDALVASLNIYLSLTDNLVAIDTASNTGVFGVTITEGLKIDVSVEIDDEIFECYVLSTPKFLPSIYSGFNFNSYCEYQGRAFGANATGIFELTGATDNGTTIHTGATLHETDFGARNDKRFRKAYLGVSGTAPVMVMETGEGERTVYAIDDKGKVDASRSLHSRDWTLSVSDFDSIDSIQLVPVILARGK